MAKTRGCASGHGHPLCEELHTLIGNEMLLDFFERAADGLWLWDLTEEGASYVTPAFGRVFGYEPDEIEHGAPFWKAICHPDDWVSSMAAVQRAITEDEPYDVTIRFRHKDGKWRWSRSVGLMLFDDDGNPSRGFGVHYDVTELMESKDRLEREIVHDPLTKLLNRRGIDAALDHTLRQVERLRCEAYAIVIDLDDFKAVNDRYSHAIGDKVLVRCARVISQTVRVVDAVGRLGGDEFIVFLLARDQQEAAAVSERITQALASEEIGFTNGTTHPITASSALVPIYDTRQGLYRDRIDVIVHAATPYLKRAKGNGKGRSVAQTLPPPAGK